MSVTGLLDDETETPDDYTQTLTGFLNRDLPLVCANPDIVVERGDRLVYCGGALAEKYREMGGTTIYLGKPHAPIYEAALSVGAELFGSALQKDRVLAIGDGVMTDVKGANDAGLDCLFVTGGIHSAENGPLADPTPQTVTTFLKEKQRFAEAFMPRLVW
ncbi:MAG: HAD hydrolase-like protein [Pseudomonadota bacterium]